MRFYRGIEDLDVRFEHGAVDLELKIHEEAEADFEALEFEVSESADFCESLVRVAEVL